MLKLIHVFPVFLFFYLMLYMFYIYNNFIIMLKLFKFLSWITLSLNL